MIRTIAFARASNKQNRTKVKHVFMHGGEIWMKIDGNALANSAELSYVAINNSSTFNTTFEGKYTGKIELYWLIWVNTHDEHCPRRSMTNAIIA